MDTIQKKILFNPLSAAQKKKTLTSGLSCLFGVGIRLRRAYAPRRKNMHPVLLKQNAAFKILVAKDEAKTKAAAASGLVSEAAAEEVTDILGKENLM